MNKEPDKEVTPGSRGMKMYLQEHTEGENFKELQGWQGATLTREWVETGRGNQRFQDFWGRKAESAGADSPAVNSPA